MMRLEDMRVLQVHMVDGHPSQQHPITSAYVERFWLPRLGPTSILLLRRLGHTEDELGRDVAEWQAYVPQVLSFELGLGTSVSPTSKLQRTVDRLCQFRFATMTEGGVLEVFRHARTLGEADLLRLPPPTIRAHDEMLAAA